MGDGCWLILMMALTLPLVFPFPSRSKRAAWPKRAAYQRPVIALGRITELPITCRCTNHDLRIT